MFNLQSPKLSNFTPKRTTSSSFSSSSKAQKLVGSLRNTRTGEKDSYLQPKKKGFLKKIGNVFQRNFIFLEKKFSRAKIKEEEEIKNAVEGFKSELSFLPERYLINKYKVIQAVIQSLVDKKEILSQSATGLQIYNEIQKNPKFSQFRDYTQLEVRSIPLEMHFNRVTPKFLLKHLVTWFTKNGATHCALLESIGFTRFNVLQWFHTIVPQKIWFDVNQYQINSKGLNVTFIVPINLRNRPNTYQNDFLCYKIVVFFKEIKKTKEIQYGDLVNYSRSNFITNYVIDKKLIQAEQVSLRNPSTEDRHIGGTPEVTEQYLETKGKNGVVCSDSFLEKNKYKRLERYQEKVDINFFEELAPILTDQNEEAILDSVQSKINQKEEEN